MVKGFRTMGPWLKLSVYSFEMQGVRIEYEFLSVLLFSVLQESPCEVLV